MLKSAGDYYWSQRAGLPAFRALIRAMEARLFDAIPEMETPILDLGCGDGHFAESNGLKNDFGIDLTWVSLKEAQSRKVYPQLQQADATRLPFADGSFGAVMSNCVVEHIPDIDQVFREAYRVLRPGGSFVLSVPNDRLNDGFFITKFLKALGWVGSAERYKTWFARLQVHFHLYSPDQWRKKLETTGFKVEQQVGYMSPRATGLFDLAHFYGAPDLVVRRFTGHWVLAPWRPIFALEEWIAAPLIAENDPAGATCCFFLVRKVGPQ